MQSIPSEFHDLLSDQARAMVYLATLMPDGSPQVTPIWFNTDGEHILLNSAVGRVKDRNMRSRPQVALVIADSQDPYRYIQVRGKVVEITTQGANEHIDQLSRKYTGKGWNGPLNGRTIYKVKPEKVSAMG
jgi:PPOX class probable F420-dependent enzyme